VGLAETSYEAPTTSDRGEGLGRAALRRRVWHPEQKMAIVQESLGSGTPTAVARRYGISTGLLYTWRKQLLTAATEGFMPCEIVEASPSAARMAALPPPAASLPLSVAGGTIEVELPGGGKLRIAGAADAATLRLILDTLAR